MLYKSLMVTGCAGDIGQAIGEILQQAAIADRVIGADCEIYQPGVLFFDVCVVVPKITSPTYLNELEAFVERFGIEVIIPASELELRFFYANNITHVGSACLLMVNAATLAVGFDKLLTAQFLEQAGLPYPWTHVVQERDPAALPCIIKSRTGRGNRDVNLVSSQEEVARLKTLRPTDIWQQMLGEESHEYTCGLYRTLQGEVRSIIFRRKLKGGLTVFAQVVQHPAITTVLTALANHLQLWGSINVQLRLHHAIPIIFEINPRFSGTVMFRHQVNFQDVVWMLQEAAGIVPNAYAPGAYKEAKCYKVYKNYVELR